jgi:hypothetical protein
MNLDRFNCLTDEMISDINMFSAGMKLVVLADHDRGLVVDMKGCRSVGRVPEFAH